ncbi:MAG TPA: sulfatase [Phycisphaerae bacterium]|nr:sulfatase [Phycisphaerae bacterium]
MTIRFWLVCVATLASLTGCGPSEPQRSKKPSVLLVVVDTLRADKLGCYGSGLGATPNFDALARDGVLFEQAYSQAPWTLPSFATLLTSLAPPQHGAGGHVGKFTRLAPSAHTVAECFRDAGYATGEIVNVDYLTPPFGVTRGFTDVDFEVYDSNGLKRDAGRTTDAALSWIRKQQAKPFFLMVHYFDLHLVYSPPLEYRRQFAAPQDRDNSAWVFGTRQQISAFRNGEITFDEASIRRAEKLYNGEVAYTDAQFGRLLAELDKLGLRNETLVVLTADHGESFLDHGSFEHGHTLYNELLHVPLIMSWPGELEPSKVPLAVSLMDVAPTLCAQAGVKPASSFAGRNLFGSDGEPTDQTRPVLLEGNLWGPPLRGWMDGGYKLIVSPERSMLFDLRVDPWERNDLSAAQPQRVRKMRTEMEEARSRPITS